MSEDFKYDVFLSHSSSDLELVRTVAERLRNDGLRVWLDDWELKVGDHIHARISEGLEQSRVLVLCMSAAAFGSEWTHLESYTFLFRDPLNKERRFIPLRLDNAPIKGSLAQFLFINWPADHEQAYGKLLEACRPPESFAPSQTAAGNEVSIARAPLQFSHGAETEAEANGTVLNRSPMGRDESSESPEAEVGRCLHVLQGHRGMVFTLAFSVDDKALVSGGGDRSIRVWDLISGECTRILEGHTAAVREIKFGTGGQFYSASDDGSIRSWDWTTGECTGKLVGHSGTVSGLALTPDGKLLVSASQDRTIRVWDIESMTCAAVLDYGKAWMNAVVVSPDNKSVVAGSEDGFITIWDLGAATQIHVLGGHRLFVWGLAITEDGSRLVSGSADATLGLWDLHSRQCIAVLEGHNETVAKVAITKDGRWAFSGSLDKTVGVWDLRSGKIYRLLTGHTSPVESVAISGSGKLIASGSYSQIRIWSFLPGAQQPASTSAGRYTNAKVLLVGESGAGKTGLSKRLALNEWEPSDSTVGAWATQWKLPVSSAESNKDEVEREIWLWDFGGQADQRLIHQLYMDETALAVLVFDGQKDDLFETLGQWDRDLTRASQKEFTKLLVAGRVDAGGLRVSRSQVEAFAKERGYQQFLETSAKANLHCEELKTAILNGIRWENIPWRSSPLLFQRLREEIIRLKDAGRVLMRINELRETLQLLLLEEKNNEITRFKDEELKAVVRLLAGPGVVWELKFGNWVLLQPERINAYAQAVIQTMRDDEHERGCLPEERVLSGDLNYQSSLERLNPDEERFILLAMHQTLVERGLCLRQPTAKGPLLVFPSYYRRERKELVGAPAVLVSYRFNGFLDDIYATLVVRLHHTDSFERDQLWRYAADFKTLTGKQLGVKLNRRAEGAGELEVYFDPAIEAGEKIIFSKYVHEHLVQNGKDVVRLRHYICPHCSTPVGNRELAMERLNEWLQQRPVDGGLAGRLKAWIGHAETPTIICSRCEKRVPLWDDLEQHFASPATKKRVRELQDQSALVLDNESKERALVGEVISTVALAGQISRERNVSDHGIDMEIEFKDDSGKATGQLLLLQLKTSDSYLRETSDGAVEVLSIKDEGDARYWMDQTFPVLLVIRAGDGEVRWMEIRDWLKQMTVKGNKTVKQIIFDGERFDVMSVRRWRDKALRDG